MAALLKLEDELNLGKSIKFFDKVDNIMCVIAIKKSVLKLIIVY